MPLLWQSHILRDCYLVSEICHKSLMHLSCDDGFNIFLSIKGSIYNETMFTFFSRKVCSRSQLRHTRNWMFDFRFTLLSTNANIRHRLNIFSEQDGNLQQFWLAIQPLKWIHCNQCKIICKMFVIYFLFTFLFYRMSLEMNCFLELHLLEFLSSMCVEVNRLFTLSM